MVFATRPMGRTATVLDGLPDVQLEGLNESDAIDLLVELSSGRIDHQEAKRIAGKSGGNLLVLTEVGRAVAEGTTPNWLLVNDLLPVGQRLEGYFLTTVRALPPESQRLLLMAAAMSEADNDLLWRAAEMVDIRPEWALAAEARRLIQLRPEFQFRHPTIRSAIYFGASEEDWRSAHLQLAQAIDEEHDPDLKAWHLAAATIGYDQEEPADDLERCANKARERGGYLAEVDVLTRSAALSPLRQQRASRILAAAGAALNGGAYLRAEELLKSGEPLFDVPFLRAQALRTKAGGASPRSSRGELASMLLTAVQIFKSIDLGLATRRCSRHSMRPTFAAVARWINAG